MSPTRSGSIIATMAWQPMPPPTSVPGAARVLRLCGQPEQKNGARLTVSGIRARAACDVGDRADPGGQARRETSVDRADERVDVEGAVARHEQFAGLVAPADDQRALGAVVERRLEELLERRVLLLDDQHLVESLGELAGLAGVERHGHQQLEQPDAGGAELVVGLEAEQAQRLADLVERVTAGGDADPVVGGAHDDPVEPVVDAVPTCQRPARPPGTRAPSRACTA